MNKTYSTKPTDIKRKWFVVDAQGKTLGRLATRVASVLIGKHKPEFAPHMDVGDFVIVVNADKIHVTGRKLDQKMYYRHSGYPGGLTEITLRDQLVRYPTRAVELAVRGMLPKNRLGRKMLRKLKVYASPEHPHGPQKPEWLEF
ncbi:MAG: 50S ribosomal protein L13 [Ardenticatenales bacterium]|nr:50S ribosomal protein L13 [Ardenticatenales bacterium]